MDDIFEKYKVVIGIIAVGIVVLAIYLIFLAGGGAADSDALLVSDGQAGSSENVGQELVILLRELKSLKLDESIFTDPVFESLRDMTVPLTPEPVGRPNPFAEVGRDSEGTRSNL